MPSAPRMTNSQRCTSVLKRIVSSPHPGSARSAAIQAGFGSRIDASPPPLERLEPVTFGVEPRVLLSFAPLLVVVARRLRVEPHTQRLRPTNQRDSRQPMMATEDVVAIERDRDR